MGSVDLNTTTFVLPAHLLLLRKEPFPDHLARSIFFYSFFLFCFCCFTFTPTAYHKSHFLYVVLHDIYCFMRIVCLVNALHRGYNRSWNEWVNRWIPGCVKSCRRHVSVEGFGHWLVSSVFWYFSLLEIFILNALSRVKFQVTWAKLCIVDKADKANQLRGVD